MSSSLVSDAESSSGTERIGNEFASNWRTARSACLETRLGKSLPEAVILLKLLRNREQWNPRTSQMKTKYAIFFALLGSMGWVLALAAQLSPPSHEPVVGAHMP